MLENTCQMQQLILLLANQVNWLNNWLINYK